VLALKEPDPFASCDQAGVRCEYEQILGCNTTLKIALPELERAAPTDPTPRAVQGPGTQFQGRASGRSIRIPLNTGHPERNREFGRIVGSSRALESALALVERVAPTQCHDVQHVWPPLHHNKGPWGCVSHLRGSRGLRVRHVRPRNSSDSRRGPPELRISCLEEKTFSRLSSGFEPTGH
jgi:hypothetical protein